VSSVGAMSHPGTIAKANSVLHEGWTLASLSECVDILDSQRVPVNSDERAKRQGRVPYYGATGQVGWIDDNLFNEELLLLGEDGAPFLDKSVPISYIITGKSWVNNHAHVLRAIVGLTDNRFLKFWLDVFDFSEYVTGSTRLKLTQTAMKRIPVSLPPLPEQRRIAQMVEDLLGHVSSAREHLVRVPMILKRFRQAVLASACSGRLTEDWRRTDGNQSATQNTRLQRLSEDAQEGLPEIHESWRWTAIGEISEIRGGIQKQPKRTPTKNAFPYLRVANVLRGRLDLSEIKQMELFAGELETYQLRAGDLLVVEGNGSLSEIGRSAIWGGEIDNCVHQNHIIRVRLRGCIPEYIDAFWNSDFGTSVITERAVTTSGLYSLSTKKVASIPLPLPPLEEQREIVRRTSALLTVSDTIARLVVNATLKADKLTQSILAKAFRGELVPTDAELARREGREYEPASVLLERIKRERASETKPPSVKRGVRKASAHV
jgi:type I restriction enzyme, S subunit